MYNTSVPLPLRLSLVLANFFSAFEADVYSYSHKNPSSLFSRRGLHNNIAIILPPFSVFPPLHAIEPADPRTSDARQNRLTCRSPALPPFRVIKAWVLCADQLTIQDYRIYTIFAFLMYRRKVHIKIMGRLKGPGEDNKG